MRTTEFSTFTEFNFAKKGKFALINSELIYTALIYSRINSFLFKNYKKRDQRI